MCRPVDLDVIEHLTLDRQYLKSITFKKYFFFELIMMHSLTLK